MARTALAVDGLATPAGPFSIAVTGTPALFLSGQVAQDPTTGTLVGADAAAQARQIFDNLQLILAATGRSEADVIRVGLYLADMGDFAAVNAVYSEFFSPPYPARTAIAVRTLPLGALVEVDAVCH
jgi:reactive intermediate/imine deaminase